jgi:hypothetical protein
MKPDKTIAFAVAAVADRGGAAANGSGYNNLSRCNLS